MKVNVPYWVAGRLGPKWWKKGNPGLLAKKTIVYSWQSPSQGGMEVACAYFQIHFTTKTSTVIGSLLKTCFSCDISFLNIYSDLGT
jgi:hypothetical protein